MWQKPIPEDDDGKLIAELKDRALAFQARLETLRIIAHRCLNSMETSYKKLGACDAETKEYIRIIREEIDKV